MLVGLIALSILAGGLAAATAVALSLPVWVAVLAYPVGGMTALLLGAAVTVAPRLATHGTQEIRSRA